MKRKSVFEDNYLYRVVMPPLEQSSLSVFEILKNLPNVSLNFIKFYSTNSVRKVYNFTLIVTRFDASLK